MKSPKAPKPSTPTTTDLRTKDPRVLRAEIDFLRQKTAEKAILQPQKAAVILSDWLKGEMAAPPAPRKKTA